MPFDAAEFRWGREPNTPRPARRAHWVDPAKTVALTFVAVPSTVALGGLASAVIYGFPPAKPIGADLHSGSVAAGVIGTGT